MGQNMVAMEKREFNRRAESIRDRFYAGEIDRSAALWSLAAVFGEFFTYPNGKCGRMWALLDAAKYLKPDISGMLEAYEG